MVKIIGKNMPKPALLALFSFIVILLLMNSAYAARQALEFSDVDVKVGSRTSKNLRDGQTINDEAEPGDNVEFRIEVRNNYTSAEDLEINDISVDVTIEGIDDGDDLDDEIASDFDLRAGRDKKVTIKFQVPLEVEEDEFDVIIRAEGDDENNTNQEVEMRLRLEVEKENHKIVITRNTLSPAEVSCSRRNVQLGATAINIGNEDEEDVTLQVLNSDLDIDITQNIGELTAEPNEDESRFSNTYSLSVPSDAEAGSYPVVLRVLYDDGRKKAEETATLTVSDCAEQKQETAKADERDEESAEVVSVTGKTTDDTEDTTAETEELPEGTVTSEESFFKSNAFVGGVIAAEVIAVIIGIVLVVSLFRRKG